MLHSVVTIRTVAVTPPPETAFQLVSPNTRGYYSSLINFCLGGLVCLCYWLRSKNERKTQ